MHPAFSVIAFTTLSGSGYGLLFWLGAHYVFRPLPLSPEFALILFGLGLLLVTVGLVASLWHLGQPQRAWRALSQWRSSWLSREGVMALVTYLPALVLCWLVWNADFGTASRVAGAALAMLSLLTVACTAMIYASLRTIPAWRHWSVVPTYLLFALGGGVLWLVALFSLTGWRPGSMVLWSVGVLLLALLLLKLSAWGFISRPDAGSGLRTSDAIGINRAMRQFEAPHTEANYITREMVFVLARKHSRRLRIIATTLFVLLPLLSLLIVKPLPGMTVVLAIAAALAFQLGALVERWLFFAEARHVVSLYYGGGPLPLR